MKFRVMLAALGWSVVSASSVYAKVDVFACEPEWAALVDEIGGEFVRTYSATHARQDPHYIRARPSLIAKMRQSDLVVCAGGGLEAGWLPLLLSKAGKRQIQPGEDFFIMAIDHVPVLEKMQNVDRRDGDIHPEGNPHVHLNPHNLTKVATLINQRLKQLDAANAATIQRQYEQFIARWTDAIARWELQAQSLKGKKIVTHHKSWSYLIDWLGLTLAGTLESKPGIPPSTKHLESLVQLTKQGDVLAIVRTPYDPEDASGWLSKRTAVRDIVLPYTVDADNQPSDLFGLFDQTLKQLIEASHVP